MKRTSPALPDMLELSDLEKDIYFFVMDHWPATPLEIAEQMNENLSDREKKKRASTKYAYYLKKLVGKKLLLSKYAGNSIIVWPLMVEKYRAIHDILKHQEPEHIAAINKHSRNQNTLNIAEEEHA